MLAAAATAARAEKVKAYFMFGSCLMSGRIEVTCSVG